MRTRKQRGKGRKPHFTNLPMNVLEYTVGSMLESNAMVQETWIETFRKFYYETLFPIDDGTNQETGCPKSDIDAVYEQLVLRFRRHFAEVDPHVITWFSSNPPWGHPYHLLESEEDPLIEKTYWNDYLMVGAAGLKTEYCQVDMELKRMYSNDTYNVYMNAYRHKDTKIIFWLGMLFLDDARVPREFTSCEERVLLRFIQFKREWGLLLKQLYNIESDIVFREHHVNGNNKANAGAGAGNDEYNEYDEDYEPPAYTTVTFQLKQSDRSALYNVLRGKTWESAIKNIMDSAAKWKPVEASKKARRSRRRR